MNSIEKHKEEMRLTKEEILRFQAAVWIIEVILLIFSVAMMYTGLLTLGVSEDVMMFAIRFVVAILTVLVSGLAVGGSKNVKNNIFRFVFFFIVYSVASLWTGSKMSSLALNIIAIFMITINTIKATRDLIKLRKKKSKKW